MRKFTTALPLLSLLLTFYFCSPVIAQKPSRSDTGGYGNLVIYTNPLDVRVEIPALKVNSQKKEKGLLIEFIPPAKYLIRVSSKKDTLVQEFLVRADTENALFFDLKKMTFTVTETSQILHPKEMDSAEAKNAIFTVVEEQPQFPGGDQNRIEFLAKNIRYPEEAIKAGIQGSVFVTFVVERDGSLSDVRILKGIGYGCDEEAIRVVKIMPRWSPGRQRGEPQRVQFNNIIKFKLNNPVMTK